jgi:hypothetical protein
MPSTTATCLCKKVSIKCEEINTNIGACHCSTCQTWGGGAYLSVEAGTNVTVQGAEHVTAYDSSEWAERGFCNKCGTHLFYKLKGTQQYMLSAGLFPDADVKAFKFDHQIFIEEKPEFYSFANKTQNMTGAEVFAKHAE